MEAMEARHVFGESPKKRWNLTPTPRRPRYVSRLGTLFLMVVLSWAERGSCFSVFLNSRCKCGTSRGSWFYVCMWDASWVLRRAGLPLLMYLGFFCTVCFFGTQQLTYSENVRCQLWQKMDPPMRRHWSGQATLGLMGFSEFVFKTFLQMISFSNTQSSRRSYCSLFQRQLEVGVGCTTTGLSKGYHWVPGLKDARRVQVLST